MPVLDSVTVGSAERRPTPVYGKWRVNLASVPRAASADAEGKGETLGQPRPARRPPSAMESPQHRKIHAINLFLSSWVLIFLTVGIVVDEWILLKTDKLPISHSPWKGCLGLLKEGQRPEDGERVWGERFTLAHSASQLTYGSSGSSSSGTPSHNQQPRGDPESLCWAYFRETVRRSQT